MESSKQKTWPRREGKALPRVLETGRPRVAAEQQAEKEAGQGAAGAQMLQEEWRWLCWLECHPVHQKAEGSIPSRGAHMGGEDASELFLLLLSLSLNQ